jgi:hypothetical protein
MKPSLPNIHSLGFISRDDNQEFHNISKIPTRPTRPSEKYLVPLEGAPSFRIALDLLHGDESLVSTCLYRATLRLVTKLVIAVMNQRRKSENGLPRLIRSL